MRVLFLFLDGVGLGSDDPAINPLARAEMPNLARLLDGRRLVADNVPLETPRASVVSLDACLGVAGMPQSASGQAALLTGLNVPALIGGHYGPWPSQAIVNLLANGNLFRAVQQMGGRAGFLNAYPPGYFAAIQSGRRLYSAIPRAAVSAGLTLKTLDDLRAGRALSADFTGRAWRERLGLADTPLLTPRSAGERMAALASEVDFTFFEYWLSDYAGHRQDMAAACTLLETVDAMVGGLTDAWDNDAGLILLTSDHGNMEDLGTRGHTTNPVPAVIVGEERARRKVAESVRSLADVAPALMRAMSA
jgi:2,3-bisphosphoglycerate-independent phosphoglycerate mutase